MVLPRRALVSPLRPAILGAALLLAVLGNSTPLFAQLPQARLTSVYPPGGQRGTKVDLATIAGTDLDELKGLYFSHPGITTVPKTAMVNGQLQPVPGQFAVNIAPDVPVGVYDVRAISLFGLSNPRTFVVGDRKETLEVEPNNTRETATPVEINTVITGRSEANGDLDFFKLTGKAGQRIIVDLRARRIDSRLNGALELYNAAGRRLAIAHDRIRKDPLLDFTLPADGDYFIKLHDAVYSGSQDNFYRLSVHNGPHIDLIVPASGLPGTTAEYTLYGRNLPGGQPSRFKSGTQVLEQLKVQIALPADAALLQPGEQLSAAEAGVDGITYTLNSPAGASNPMTVYIASSPTAAEVEPNDTPETAQKLVPPVEVTGQFEKRGDTDHYAFDAKPGDVYWFEVFGQRNGSAADPYLVIEQIAKNDKGEIVKNDKGLETITRITALDDNPLNVGGTQFNTLTDDPVFRFAAGANALYRVTVRDRYFESRGSPELSYRLSIRKEVPDFRLVVVPPFPGTDANLLLSTWELGLRKGDNAHVNVLAFRRDGFNGPIDVTVEGLPAGVTSPGTTIGPNLNAATLVLRSTEQAADWIGSIRVIGKAQMEDPATAKAVAEAEAASKAAVAALPPLDKAAVDTAAAAKAAADKAAAAKTALDNDAKNEALIKAKTDADTASTKAAEAAKVAADAKAAGDKKIADAAAAITAANAAHQKAMKEVAHDARGGTIVWNGAQQIAPQTRVSRSVTLAVLHDTAPFQLTTEVGKVDVNQGRQVLVPVKVLKRAGFDNNVTMTFVTPPPNVVVENKPINKGSDSEIYKILVQNNVAPGVYAILLQGTSQVSYSRNPEAAALAAKEKEVADKLAVDTADAAKKAVDAKAAADKKATDTAAAAKAATDAKTAADKLATDTDTAAKAAVVEQATAVKAATDTAAAAKAAADKAAAAKVESDKDLNNKALADAKAAADKAAQEAADAAKKAADAKTAADKKATDTADAAKKAAEAKVVADKAAVDTAAAAKTAADEKVVADKAMADTAAAAAAATAAKAVADKKATDTANVSKPANLNAFTPATTVTINVKLAPGTLAAAPANGGALKRGANVEVKVTLNRTNGYVGPATLSLPLPPNVTGITAPEVTIPADKNEGVLVISATGDATMGALANMVVRASMEFNGPAAIDAPLTLNVSQ